MIKSKRKEASLALVRVPRTKIIKRSSDSWDTNRGIDEDCGTGGGDRGVEAGGGGGEAGEWVFEGDKWVVEEV